MRSKDTVNSVYNGILRNTLLFAKGITCQEAIILVGKGLLRYSDLTKASFGNLPLELIAEYAKEHGKDSACYMKDKTEFKKCNEKMHAISKAVESRYPGEFAGGISLVAAILFITNHEEEPWLYDDENVAAESAIREYSSRYEYLNRLEEKSARKHVAELTIDFSRKNSGARLLKGASKKKAQRKPELV